MDSMSKNKLRTRIDLSLLKIFETTNGFFRNGATDRLSTNQQSFVKKLSGRCSEYGAAGVCQDLYQKPSKLLGFWYKTGEK